MEFFELYKKIENNDHLKSIEIPVINEYVNSISGSDEVEKANSYKNSGEANFNLEFKGPKVGIKDGHSKTSSDKTKQIESWEKQFSGALLKVFQIKDVMDEIQEILKI